MRKLNKLLLVAFHFPPLSGGSGVHRASKFARYLPENGWEPYVLTVSRHAHERVDSNSYSEIPEKQVIRAFTLDARRHLSFRGRYLRWCALPDQWSNWVVTGIPLGLAAIHRKQLDLILVTFPITTAVLIGLVLQRLTGKPLVVDFRDSMTEENYPSHRQTRAIWRWIEKSVIKHGARFIFTAESARLMYLNRYPNLAPSDCIVIPNGYDEDDFASIKANNVRSVPPVKPLRLVHAGLIYPQERNPNAFFRAVRRMKAEGRVSRENLMIHLRASGSEQHYSTLLREFEIDDVVHLLPNLPHREALQDTAAADGLLVFQAASCDHQIPAKVYEYLRLEKPIFALTSTSGDTAALLRRVRGATIADLADEDSLVQALPKFLDSVRNGTHPLPDPNKVHKFTRRNQTAQLARHLDELVYSDLMTTSTRSANDLREKHTGPMV